VETTLVFAQVILIENATWESGRALILHELAWSNEHSELARLIRRDDIPRKPHRLPRPFTAEQDQLLRQEFLRRNDLGGNAFLLIRHCYPTGVDFDRSCHTTSSPFSNDSSCLPVGLCGTLGHRTTGIEALHVLRISGPAQVAPTF